ncbi:hypothetical protein SCHPADRAFT_67362 [Schizopora paradoxa]|uniref:Uncharacterized protein n=1 Tax=Schizopora paradoxa TaxID=27342 RepID=A0A0H2S5N3_9AGAM|nr:hypothetical protein SCHPADRAFT_67362 [Schizopora paradoxa]
MDSSNFNCDYLGNHSSCIDPISVGNPQHLNFIKIEEPCADSHRVYHRFQRSDTCGTCSSSSDSGVVQKPVQLILNSENTFKTLKNDDAFTTWIDLKQRFATKAYELRNSIIFFEDIARTLPASSVARTLCRSLQDQILPQLEFINKIVLSELRHAQSTGGILSLKKTDYPAEEIISRYRHLQRVLRRLEMSLEDMNMDASYKPTARVLPIRDSSHSEARLFETFSPFRSEILLNSMHHMDAIITVLRSPRLRKGLEKVRYNQEYSRSTFMNIATIATFFSSVTATTLQYSYSQTSTSQELWTYVNGVWFASLVFSIASAANSFLGVALFQRPEYYGHSSLSEYRLIRFWFDKCPMFFLIISGSLFGIGLCLFSVSSNQAYYTRLITIILTGAHAVFIVAIILMASIRFVRLLVPNTFYIFCPSWEEDDMN